MWLRCVAKDLAGCDQLKMRRAVDQGVVRNGLCEKHSSPFFFLEPSGAPAEGLYPPAMSPRGLRGFSVETSRDIETLVLTESPLSSPTDRDP